MTRKKKESAIAPDQEAKARAEAKSRDMGRKS